MSPDRLTALRNFFACAEPRLPHTVAVMFSKLAETAPEIRQLFKDDPEVAQARYLLMLRRIVQLTRSKHLWPVQAFTGTASIPALAGLGYSHARMGITREHFDKMKVALGQSFGEDSPEEFTPEIEEALGFIFDVIARSVANPDHAPVEETGLKTPLLQRAEALEPANFAAFFGSAAAEDADEDLPALGAAAG
jgi:hemoglobin-like flavoprotein